MRSRTPLPARGQGQVRPFLEAAVLFAALCIFARSAALGLAAAIAAPLPMAETLLWLGRQAAGETASSVQEQAEPESVPAVARFFPAAGRAGTAGQHRGLSCAPAGGGCPPGRRGEDH